MKKGKKEAKEKKKVDNRSEWEREKDRRRKYYGSERKTLRVRKEREKNTNGLSDVY